MYRNEPYTGKDLPPKFLSLSYDDGPGEHTLEIAEFLFNQNIRATFFVVGKYALHHQDILEKIAAWGHLIGNHTYEHPDMPYYLSINGDIQNQVLRTDSIIKKYINQDIIYFRSPYGKWSPEVASELNRNILSAANHIGPIHWDVGGVDCFFWQNGNTVEKAIEKYLSDIDEKKSGIIVMHDDIADMNYLKEKNNTLELTKQLIPLLRDRGYNFVRLDEIESIKRDAANVLRFTLRVSNGKYLSLSQEKMICTAGKKNCPFNEITMIDLGHGKIALRASNGLYLSLQEQKKSAIEAIAMEAHENESFDLVPVISDQVILRAFNGYYLAVGNKPEYRLFATARYMRGANIFRFSPVGTQSKKSISLQERYRKLKRQALYVKSKIAENAGKL